MIDNSEGRNILTLSAIVSSARTTVEAHELSKMWNLGRGVSTDGELAQHPQAQISIPESQTRQQQQKSMIPALGRLRELDLS